MFRPATEPLTAHHMAQRTTSFTKMQNKNHNSLGLRTQITRHTLFLGPFFPTKSGNKKPMLGLVFGLAPCLLFTPLFFTVHPLILTLILISFFHFYSL